MTPGIFMACFLRTAASTGICPLGNHQWVWEVFQEAVCRSISFSSICLWGKTSWHSRSEWLNSTKLLSCGLSAVYKMAESCYGDYAVHKPLQTWLLQVCVQHLLLLPERKKSSEGQWFHSRILGNLRWHNWHLPFEQSLSSTAVWSNGRKFSS
jgi:coproporphyrinogen III oxidase-like Fe-S oxidoreductase